MTINERIKNRRKQIGKTVEDVAKIINKNRATVYRYENSDIEDMPISIIEPLAKALECSPVYLMGWVDNPNERYNPSGKKADTLAADEEQLLTNYNKLNPTGKDKVQDYTEDLTDNEKYTAPESELERKGKIIKVDFRPHKIENIKLEYK